MSVWRDESFWMQVSRSMVGGAENGVNEDGGWVGGSQSRFLAGWLAPDLHWQQQPMRKNCRSGKERGLRDKKRVFKEETSALERYHKPNCRH